MTSSRRYVFDTNTLISAALFEGGKSRKAFRLALKHGTVLLSQATFEELDEVLARKRLTTISRLKNVQRLSRRWSSGAGLRIQRRKYRRAATRTMTSFWSWQ